MPDKKLKAQGKEMSWLDLYLELKTNLETRVFKLEERIESLEAANNSRTDMRIGGK